MVFGVDTFERFRLVMREQKAIAEENGALKNLVGIMRQVDWLSGIGGILEKSADQRDGFVVEPAGLFPRPSVN